MRRVAGYASLASMAAAVVLFALQTPPLAAGSFADDIARLSEPEGFFDTDNLISNERTYLDVVPALVKGGVSGGAYIGVGPDQNFSYIARIRPSVAYIIDIRRDNLLLHLLFKALFARAPDRVAYLSLLTGRSPPAVPAGAGVEELVRAISEAPRAETTGLNETGLNETIRGFGVPLSPADFATIGRFHGAFIQRGLALQFNSHGRPPQSHYPTLRDLIVATDRSGRAWHYLASEADYQFVRQLQARDLIVPVVGDVERPPRAEGDRPDDCVAGRAGLGVLHLERRVLPLSRRRLRPVHGQPERVAARRAECHDSLDLRRGVEHIRRAADGRVARGKIGRGSMKAWGA